MGAPMTYVQLDLFGRRVEGEPHPRSHRHDLVTDLEGGWTCVVCGLFFSEWG